ncbi:arylsulfotransferase family protein [Defluviimonas aestuarii]|uniref:arylsulfotransferase family protein n=1 Tax=Albidovulum aestuarii TaxID=1130726 RepID=UPI002499BDB6|nr:arylsulfotransferase family protein [Defluviimonas aestuarii]MDI3337229.1 arylsulfotransferase family protein [Defluviimonas aestuarii]
MPQDLERKVFRLSATVLILGLVFGAGLYSGVKRNFVYKGVKSFKDTTELIRTEWQNVVPHGEPVHFLQDARYSGSGVTINRRPDDDSLVLLSGFFDGENGLRLLRRDGTPAVKWSVPFSRYFSDLSYMLEPPQTDHNIDTHGALIEPDGSVVFNFEYGGTVKLSRCGDPIWTRPMETHHSIIKSERSGYIVPTRGDVLPEEFGKYWPLSRQTSRVKYFMYDLITKLTDDGEVVYSKPLPEIFLENNLLGVVTATGSSMTDKGPVEGEITHVNKIAELPAAIAGKFPNFESGDLMVSVRMHNLIFVVDPDTWKVKWYQTGPWLRQHDPQFGPDGKIWVFNNNTFRLNLTVDFRPLPDAPLVSNILKIDPKTRETEIAFGQRPGEEFLSVIRGKIDLVEGGGALVTEFEGGRAFEFDSNRDIVWEYINRYDAERVQEITGAWRYPASYFTVENWDCP